jgi:hypothetical protein
MIFGYEQGVLADEFKIIFEEWNDGPRGDYSALGHNLRFDDRVSKNRAQTLKEIWDEGQQAPRGCTFIEALTRYKATRVYTSAGNAPDYLDDVRNAGNLPVRRNGLSVPLADGR